MIFIHWGLWPFLKALRLSHGQSGDWHAQVGQRYAYTAAGKLHTKTLNNGQVTTYDYDSLGRLTHIHYPDSSEDETYTYDQGINGKGRLTGRSGKGWTSVYEYNAVGQITSETRTVSGATFITRYAYDKSGVLTAMTYPDGRTVTYAPNPNGQPLSAVTTKSGTGKTLAEGAAYKPFGPLSGFDMGNGMEIRKTFDQDYRLKTLTAGSVMNLSYIHYMNGMIREITNALDPARSQFFTYDKRNRGQANNALTQQSRHIINVNKKTVSISEGESKRGNDQKRKRGQVYV